MVIEVAHIFLVALESIYGRISFLLSKYIHSVYKDPNPSVLLQHDWLIMPVVQRWLPTGLWRLIIFIVEIRLIIESV